jgi:hypothetical protein
MSGSARRDNTNQMSRLRRATAWQAEVRGQTAEVALLGQEKIETRRCSVSAMHRKRLTMQP